MSERRELFRAMVGSHNYNLNDETSDKDYKAFVIPTFDDLYKGEMYSTSKVGQDEDYTVHDIRKLSSLWWKANLNFLEVLYSRDVKLGGVLPEDWEDFKQIINMRERIVRMNLPYLFHACWGMHFTKMKQINKGTESTKELVDKFGYDTKQALHAYRILDFLVRFARTNNFQQAMTYTDDEREILIGLKRGEMDWDTFTIILEHTKRQAEDVSSFYTEAEPDKETKEELDRIIYRIVEREVVS